MQFPFFRVRVAMLAGLLAGTAGAEAQTITTAVPILTLSPDSRSAALGEAGVAISPDANSAYYNAGKLGFVPTKYSVSLSYAPWLRNVTDDMGLGFVSGYGKVGTRSAISASLMYFDLGEIEYRTNQNLPNGTFNPKEYAFTVSYGQKLTDNLGIGVSGRYIRSNLVGNSGGNDARPGNAGAVDLGVYYSKETTIGAGIYNLAFGGSILNIGNKITYLDASNPSFLPTTLKLGTAITREIDTYNKVTLALDASKLLVPSPYYEDPYNPNDLAQRDRVRAKNQELSDQSIINGIITSFGDAPGGASEELREINLSAGLEYSYNDLLMVRAGYFYEAPDKGARQYLSLGAGLRYQQFGVDGTYLVPNSQANPLSQTIRISLHFNFNKVAEAFDENGAGGTSGDVPTN